MKILGMHTSLYMLIAVAAAAVVIIIVLSFLLRRRPRSLNTPHFQSRWQEAQKLCSDPKTWPLAIIDADKLLDEALKRRRYKGKTMGERLVSAQHDITNNDEVWFGHKLRNKIVHEEMKKLKKRDVIAALIGFRGALKDLGAME